MTSRRSQTSFLASARRDPRGVVELVSLHHLPRLLWLDQHQTFIPPQAMKLLPNSCPVAHPRLSRPPIDLGRQLKGSASTIICEARRLDVGTLAKSSLRNTHSVGQWNIRLASIYLLIRIQLQKVSSSPEGHLGSMDAQMLTKTQRRGEVVAQQGASTSC